ncbi:hypothetical protein METBIDRAFT_39284 [Metschnikowia bicuspidata var. bicuspidata NRRL YB-4993]|uniref:RNA polymerase II subunit A C-terminal domain phosphatase n=1 Tax=Metschnikowia bicuspidata var. bicuspidata NRRL YB-4993 TaxID=869754 RepID=A0A1A0HFC0_9ASCO|nr:hypothetical protein METBIDRAFT_39284 [Metschnikowia bicuspidata var. bicuspidata NRRL YB-4993]OBA22592.1 hypothetical protein METBIDRAFT_39284 [Metschnikowia bicuspidata var. bicuspidata NRRL YB-4993]
MTSISLPASVPFPVTVSSVLCVAGDTVKKHAPLFRYRYWDYQDDPMASEAVPRKVRVERIGSFELPIEGEVVSVNIHPQKEIAHLGIELYVIKETCTHTVQYGGLCALCGKAVEDEKDYSGYTYEDRAPILMAHDNTGLKVSADEAAKIERLATQTLVSARKLILVVDLDQTVIHATVDPTVGEWQRDPQNPNYPYVKDVRSFSLEEEPVLPPGWTGPKPAPNRCWYYVKERPGLAEFLARVSQLYELHIYTMATRNYALAIAQIIDPDGRYFGDRILSRDESGLLTHKNLRRLFPVDQLMVVIIDDRGDVWLWELNLIKVVPYDFFVGIGDINLSFLPKKNGQLLGPSKHGKTVARLEALEDNSEEKAIEDASEAEDNNERMEVETQVSASSGTPAETSTEESGPNETSENASPVDRMLHLGGGEDNKDLLIEQLMTRSQLVEQQQHDRPLAKLQHSLERIIHEHDKPSPKNDDDEHLLRDDDTELSTLKSALENIHEEYFRIFSVHSKDPSIPRPDLTTIVPMLKLKCLQGVVVLFSGILPLGMNIDNADIVIWCRQFGVKVVNEVYSEVTHVVCRDPNATVAKAGLTLKVRVAKKSIPGVKIVSPDWLFACLSQWARVCEDDFAIELPDKDWYVPQLDVDKYHIALEVQRQKALSRSMGHLGRPREDSLSAIEDYDFNDANAEVDDFLAGLSDDDDENIDEKDEDADVSEKEDETPAQPSGSLFLKGLMSESRQKRRANESEDDDSESPETDVMGDSEDMDELEKELLDELDNMD